MYADRKDRTSGDITIGSLTWTNLDMGLDIVLTAEAADNVEVGLSIAHPYGAEASANAYLDCVTVVAGSPVNSLADKAPPNDAHFGVVAWSFAPVFDQLTAGASIIYRLQAADISGGQVRLRLRIKTEDVTGGGINTLVAANPDRHLVVWAKNIFK